MSDFPQAGEWCESCRPRWEAKHQSPMVLVALPQVTERYHTEIVVCPFCDGDPIIKFSEHNAENEESDADE